MNYGEVGLGTGDAHGTLRPAHPWWLGALQYEQGGGTPYDINGFNCATWAARMLLEGLDGINELYDVNVPDWSRRRIITPRELLNAF